jgi:hypothetical protein
VPDSDLEQIESSGFEPATPDKTAELEKNELDTDQERETKRLQNVALAQDINLRKDFAWDIFYLIVAWLILVFVVLILQGFAVAISHQSYYRKLWIRCGHEKGGVPFRVANANPGGSRVEGGRHRC